MSAFYLTIKAEADMRNIGRYTEKIWGREQRNTYLTMLDGLFRDIADKPLRGRPYDEVREGYRKLNAGKHVIFYRTVEDGIEIVRVLHGRMDVERHL